LLIKFADELVLGFAPMKYCRIAICAIALPVMGATQSSFATETLQQRGQQLAQRLCGECHAIGRTGASPLPAAPRFRALDNRVDLSQLPDRIQEGLLSGHQDMPMFRFSRDDADAIVAYMRSIQGR
jgi:cytochrome c